MHACSVGNVLINDMISFAKDVRGRNNVTNGILSPANRFLADTGVPECCRYTVRQAVLAHTPGASKTQLDAMRAAKESLAAKRARIA